jgi:hypothetical protein
MFTHENLLHRIRYLYIYIYDGTKMHLGAFSILNAPRVQ